MKISAGIICFNEEKKIERALKSLQWADEIVVVDSHSTDQTPNICQKYTNVFIQNPWSGFLKQRQLLISQAKYDWIFFLDADEYCSDELINKVKQLKEKNNPSSHLFKIRRKEYMWGNLYKYGCGNPSYQDRFFNKNFISYVGDIHEYPKYDGKPEYIEECIHHDSFDSIEDMLIKLNHYTTLEAEAMFQSGIRHSWPHMFFSGINMFLKGYIKKKGFLDGPYGLIMAVFDGMSFFLRQAKLWKLWQDFNKNN